LSKERDKVRSRDNSRENLNYNNRKGINRINSNYLSNANNVNASNLSVGNVKRSIQLESKNQLKKSKKYLWLNQ